MSHKHDLISTAFHTLQDIDKPTQGQKDKMLSHILVESEAQNISFLTLCLNWIITRPWRFAFTFSTVQAILFTLLFNTRYTHLFLIFFGG